MNHLVRMTLVAGLCAALPGMALADGPHSAERARCAAKRDAAFLSTHDTNRDGVLDRVERRALRQQRFQEAKARYDVDRDGILSPVERQRMHQDRVAQKMARFDADKNGSISRQEANQPCSRLAHHFDRVDADQNGQISAAELGAAHRKMRGGFGRHHRPDAARP